MKIISGFISIESFYAGIFFKSLTGLVISIVTYSFFVTSFKTVNVGFILIAAFLICELQFIKKKFNRKICLSSFPGNSLNSESTDLWKKIYPLIISSLLIYAWFSMIILKGGKFHFSMVSSDTIFYSDISKMISITGQENTYGMSNLISTNYHGLMPYHYFELWLNAVFSSAFKSIHLISLFLFTYPFLNFITLIGFYSLIEKVTKVSLMHQIAALFFLFMGGFYFNNSNPSTDFTLNMVESPMESYGEKFAIYYPFIICTFSFFMERYFSLALISLLILPLLSISTAPGIFGGLLLFSSLAAFFNRMDRRIFLRIILYIFSLAAFIFSLYHICGNLTISTISNKELVSYTDLSDQSNHFLKIFFAELFLRIKNCLFHLWIIYTPISMVALWVLFKKNLRLLYGHLILMVSCVCFVSLVIYQIVYRMSNSWQFYTNSLTLLNVTLILFSIIILFENSGSFKLNSKLRRIIFAFLLIFLIAKGFNSRYVYDLNKKINTNLYSENFLTTIQNTNLNKKEKVFGATLIKGKRYYETESALAANVTPYISLMPQFLPCVYMNTFENFNSETTDHIIKTGNSAAENYVFYQFMETQKKENTFVNVEQSQSDFIDKYRIRYLIVSDTFNISKKITRRFDKIITDSKSKQKFILLK